MEFFAYSGLASIALLAIDLHDFLRFTSARPAGAGGTGSSLGVPAEHSAASAIEYDRAA